MTSNTPNDRNPSCDSRNGDRELQMNSEDTLIISIYVSEIYVPPLDNPFLFIYKFPERGKMPLEQVLWAKGMLINFSKREHNIHIHTCSPDIVSAFDSISRKMKIRKKIAFYLSTIGSKGKYKKVRTIEPIFGIFNKSLDYLNDHGRL